MTNIKNLSEVGKNQLLKKLETGKRTEVANLQCRKHKRNFTAEEAEKIDDMIPKCKSCLVLWIKEQIMLIEIEEEILGAGVF